MYKITNNTNRHKEELEEMENNRLDGFDQRGLRISISPISGMTYRTVIWGPSVKW